jgi:hypothetical protein
VFPWLDLLYLIVRVIVHVFFDLSFWLVLALVAYQYYQMQKDQIRMFGVYGFSLRRQVATAAALGVVGGLVGSFLLTFVGVPLNNLGLGYIWPLAIALMLVNLRFMCFAYAGGLVALANVLFGWRRSTSRTCWPSSPACTSPKASSSSSAAATAPCPSSSGATTAGSSAPSPFRTSGRCPSPCCWPSSPKPPRRPS